jgi:hypothetical protein
MNSKAQCDKTACTEAKASSAHPGRSIRVQTLREHTEISTEY